MVRIICKCAQTYFSGTIDEAIAENLKTLKYIYIFEQ